MGRMIQIQWRTEQMPSSSDCLLSRDGLILAYGYGREIESRGDWKRRGDAHNGVRGDDVVVVRESRVSGERNHQSDEGGRHYVAT